MKSLPSGLQDHLSSGTTTLVLVLEDHAARAAVRASPITMCLSCSMASPIEAVTGFTASEVQSTLGLAVDNLTVVGALSSATINENDLAAGLYDNADIEIWRVNWNATGPARADAQGKSRRGASAARPVSRRSARPGASAQPAGRARLWLYLRCRSRRCALHQGSLRLHFNAHGYVSQRHRCAALHGQRHRRLRRWLVQLAAS